ncbi:MAG: Fe-S cluster assembly sulfur transfer protein SufU [Chthoniobacterales bacterium]
MSDLEDLYQEIILDHNKRPKNFRVIENPTHFADGLNPLCGDQFKIMLNVEGDKITDISFQGEGCAISKASASLMTNLMKGRTVAEGKDAVDAVLQLLTSSEKPEKAPRELGNVLALEGVRRFPVRVKCATLAWHACRAALDGQESISTENT